MEILQHTRIFKANCYLKVHNVYLKLAQSISGLGPICDFQIS